MGKRCGSYLYCSIYTLTNVNSQYNGKTCLKVGYNGSNNGSLHFPCPNGTVAFTVNFTFNGGISNIEVINQNMTIAGTSAVSSYLKNSGSNAINTSTLWTNGAASGSTINITSIGGDWNTNSSWDLNHVPNATNNAIIASGSPVTMNANNLVGDVTINSGGALTVNSGTFTVNNSFLIKSDATGTGSYINNGAFIASSSSAQRYIAKDNSWHLISSPVNGQFVKPAFAPTTVDNTFDFYKWDESIVNSATTYPWINIRDNAGAYANDFDNFVNGQGYLVAYSSNYGGSATHLFSGTLNYTAQTVNVAYGVNNFNLLGNPFPSAIDWNASGYTGRDAVLGTTPPIWVWNGTVGQYGTIGINGVTNVIAPHQGFFVEATSAGSFTIPTNAKAHPGSQNFLKSIYSDMIRLKVNSTVNTYSDEIIVNLNSNATANQGVTKWFSLLSDAPSLYSVKNSKNLSINTFPAVTNNMVVPVSFKAGVNGNYTITASEFNSFTSNPYIYLKDLKTNYIQDLNQNATYNFVGQTTDNADRFQLIFSLTPLSISENQIVNNTSIYAYDNILYVNSTERVKQISIYNTIGQLIYSTDNTAGSFKYNLNGNTIGYYIVKVITDKNVSSEKVFVK